MEKEKKKRPDRREYLARKAREYRKLHTERYKKTELEQRIKHQERRNLYSEQYYLEHKDNEDFSEKRKKGAIRYYYKNKDKVRARKMVSTALLNGKIIRPDVCSICNNKSKIEAHHPDYNSPLEVVWLCKKCHYGVHKKYNPIDQITSRHNKFLS